jgi:ribosomal protein S28E/S33
LNYGDVFVQTAAEKERFIFRKVPNPNKIKDLLMKLEKEKEKEKDQKLGHMLHKELG